MSAVNAIGRQRQSQLSAFLLSDVKRTGKTLGTGSYGSVLEVWLGMVIWLADFRRGSTFALLGKASMPT